MVVFKGLCLHVYFVIFVLIPAWLTIPQTVFLFGPQSLDRQGQGQFVQPMLSGRVQLILC